MYYFSAFFIVYLIGILITVNISSMLCIIVGISTAVISYHVNKKVLANMLIVLFAILSVLLVNYNSKSELTQYLNQSVDIIAEVEAVNSTKSESQYIGYKVRIIKISNLNLSEHSILYVNKSQNVEINSIIQTTVNVSELLDNKNHMLFSYKKSMRAKKIYTSLFAVSEPKVIEIEYSQLNKYVNVIKSKIEHIVHKNLNDENASVILSIILGDKSYLDSNYYEDIQKVGLAHLFAVSGLHIGILYKALMLIFLLFGINKRVSWVITWSMLWFYGFIIGVPISVLRSLLMFTFLFGADVLYRKYNSINSIVISALIILIMNPFYIFDVGFQLSYIVALSLIIYNNYIKIKINISNTIVNSFIMYIFIQVFTFPLMTYYFNYITVIGLLYNLVLVPIISGLIVVAFILVAIGFISFYPIIVPLKIMDYMLNTINYLINCGANLSFTGFKICSMNILQTCFFYIFVAIIIYIFSTKKFNYKKLFAFTYIMFYCLNIIMLPNSFSGLRINIVDIGQGLFINLQYKGHSFVFDCGSTSENCGEYTSLPYLLKNNISIIDAMFISHWHSDHYNGANKILSNLEVKNVYASSEDNENLLLKSALILKSKKSIIVSKDLKIDILWPDKDYKSENENNMSNVYMIKCGNTKILLAGDIEKDVESIILDRLEDVDIVVVPHHGSKTSSTQEFIDKIKPEIAILSYGRNNYGIPHQEVIERYLKNDSKVLKTYEDGEINIMVINDKIYYNTYIGNHSKNIIIINSYIVIVNLAVILLILSLVYTNNKYIADRYMRGKYEL